MLPGAPGATETGSSFVRTWSALTGLRNKLKPSHLPRQPLKPQARDMWLLGLGSMVYALGVNCPICCSTII